jgi:hypothetical protein
MDDHDVRDLEGRLGRLGIAVLVGGVVAIVVAAVLPQESSRGWGGGAFGAANPVLIAAGACGIAIGVYAVLGVWLRGVRPPARLPVARVARKPRRVHRDRH